MEKHCIFQSEILCNNCGECDKCDLDSNKLCNNCGKCLQLDDYDSRAIGIDDLMEDTLDVEEDKYNFNEKRENEIDIESLSLLNKDLEDSDIIIEYIDDVDGLSELIEDIDKEKKGLVREVFPGLMIVNKK